MKKILISFVFMLNAITSFTQETEHLTFKGVPIDGTLSEYVVKMKSVGFKYLGGDDGTAILEGDFAGFKECNIGVSTLKSTNIVYAIAVIFPEKNDWASLETNYKNLKLMLTKKYGEPTECVEKFQGYGNPQTDNDKLHKLAMDECTWYTSYSTLKGDIRLSINKRDLMSYYVSLVYLDKINHETVFSAAMDDL